MTSSIQEISAKHRLSSLRRPILPFIVKAGLVLVCINGLILLVVLVGSRMLPSAGAVAFFANNDATADIYARDLAGHALINLTNNNASNDNVAFSPDGQYLTFTSSSNGGFPQLYLKRVKCSSLFALCNGGLRQLTDITTNTNAGVLFANWSPNGNQIAYTRGGEIYILNLETGISDNLTQNPANDDAPVWSPDGRQIAFSSQRDSDMAEIYLINSDGSHLQRLTHNDVWDAPPIWSPDGTQIAFMSQKGSGYYLLVLDIRDGSIRDIAPDLENVYNPVWTSKGSQIEFWVGSSQSSSLYTVDMLQGGTRKLIVSLTGPNQYFTRMPDGHYLVLHGPNEMESTDLYLLDGNQMRFIADSAGPPVWWP
ncbi:MAG: PD40 domain-containing protein [Anaerolineae bacterium]|nr:PD40 domain-containing protein [Anaerolineae bacterium]